MRIDFDEPELRRVTEELLQTTMSDSTRYMGLSTDEGFVIGAFSNFNGYDGEITVVARGKNPPMLQAIRYYFHYVWDICKCRRVTSLCYADNPQAVRFNKMLGFKDEGLMRQAGKEQQDVIVFGMLREEFNERFKHDPKKLRKAA